MKIMIALGCYAPTYNWGHHLVLSVGYSAPLGRYSAWWPSHHKSCPFYLFDDHWNVTSILLSPRHATQKDDADSLMLTWSRSSYCRSEVSKQRKDIYRKGDAIFHDLSRAWATRLYLHGSWGTSSISWFLITPFHQRVSISPLFTSQISGGSVRLGDRHTLSQAARPCDGTQRNPTGELEWLSGGLTFTTFRSTPDADSL